jgi:hypothetical protein
VLFAMIEDYRSYRPITAAPFELIDRDFAKAVSKARRTPAGKCNCSSLILTWIQSFHLNSIQPIAAFEIGAVSGSHRFQEINRGENRPGGSAGAEATA